MDAKSALVARECLRIRRAAEEEEEQVERIRAVVVVVARSRRVRVGMCWVGLSCPSTFQSRGQQGSSLSLSPRGSVGWAGRPAAARAHGPSVQLGGGAARTRRFLNDEAGRQGISKVSISQKNGTKTFASGRFIRTTVLQQLPPQSALALHLRCTRRKSEPARARKPHVASEMWRS